MSAVERSDLPVGQQSKGSSKRPPLVGPLDVEEDAPSLPSMGRVTGKVKIFTEEGWAAALPDADPESDVAIAEQMLPAGADVFGMVPLSSGCRRGECDLCDFGSIHAPCAHDCHVPESALPDVVGTPDHPEARELLRDLLADVLHRQHCAAGKGDECRGPTHRETFDAAAVVAWWPDVSVDGPAPYRFLLRSAPVAQEDTDAR